MKNTTFERCRAFGVSRASYYRGIKAGLSADEIIARQRKGPNVSALARACGVSRMTIWRKLQEGHTVSEIRNMKFRPKGDLDKDSIDANYGISTTMYQRRLDQGWSEEEIRRWYTTYKGEPLEWWGRTYRNYTRLLEAINKGATRKVSLRALLKVTHTSKTLSSLHTCIAALVNRLKV